MFRAQAYPFESTKKVSSRNRRAGLSLQAGVALGGRETPASEILKLSEIC